MCPFDSLYYLKKKCVTGYLYGNVFVWIFLIERELLRNPIVTRINPLKIIEDKLREEGNFGIFSTVFEHVF